MSRRVKKAAFDGAEWTGVEPIPDWLAAHLQKAGEAEDGTLGTADRFDEDAKRYLVSRARYIVGYNRAIHQDRLHQLAIADEALAVEKPLEALGLIHDVYPSDRLHFDETLNDPSDDARTRASLLYARLSRFKEKTLAESPNEWPPYNDDLLAILKAWSVPRDEKKALAQQLLLENPQSSQSQIAKMSGKHPEQKFDQSCLSQWIISGMVLDPYKHLRPSQF